MDVLGLNLVTNQPRAPQTRPLLVVIATDGSQHSIGAARLLTRILPAGSAELRLVTVLDYAIYPYGPSGDPLPDAMRRLDEVAAEERMATDEIRRAAEASQHRVGVYHRFGNPADALLELVEEWEPNLVVVGRRGLGQVKGLLMGSVSSKLLHHSKAPVLVVS